MKDSFSWGDNAYGNEPPSQADKNMLVEFYDDAVEIKANGGGEFVNRLHIKIIMDGGKNVLVKSIKVPDENDRRPDQSKYRDFFRYTKRFPAQNQAYLESRRHVPDGFPLEKWQGLSPAQLKHLDYNFIYTVEQLAELDDMAVQNLGLGYGELRKKAQQFADASKADQPVRKLSSENERLRTDIEALQNQLVELSQVAEKAKAKPKRSRTKKVEADDAGAEAS